MKAGETMSACILGVIAGVTAVLVYRFATKDKDE